ncbi:chitobiase/beta-hexosaminidase C-terminal domain-containing protein, partial [Candidatus Poribacteria bacterium]
HLDKYVMYHLNGLPAKTNGHDGWERWEWEFTTCERAVDGCFYVFPRGNFDATNNFTLKMADVAFIELPEEPLKPFTRGEGVTFRGGPGNLPIKIEEVIQEAGNAKVRTTGVLYTFDFSNNTITAEQLIDFPRTIAVWKSSLDLRNMEILISNDIECVLANDAMTIGIQCDGLMLISPHKELSMTCHSMIAGRWNRLEAGHLLVVDDFGGITVNPHVPLGSGRLARAELVSRDIDFSEISGTTGNVDFLSDAKPGWEIMWTVNPGERLGTSVFPPRPFDWEKSFDMIWALTFQGLKTDVYSTIWKEVNVFLLWDFCMRGWGMSYGPKHIPKDEVRLKEHIEAIKTRGDGAKIINYMSAYFWYTRDAEEYIGEVRRWKDTYGIDGVYSDGIPSQEWLVAYEEMRMLRELFPDGTLIIHTTGQTGNGGPPLALPDIFCPFIDTYATATLRGEWVLWEQGEEWVYPRYISSQYRKANCIGNQKGDRWCNGETMIPQVQQDLINLVYNGRARMRGPYNEEPKQFAESYLPVLRKLEALWREKGGEPYFYDRYYLPKAQEWTGHYLGRAGMPIVTQRQTDSGVIQVALEALTPGAKIHYTIDGTEPTEDSPVYSKPINFDPGTTLRAKTMKAGMDPSRLAVIELGI